MTNERFLLDTVFIQALLNARDQYHHQAKAFLPHLRTAREIWVTEAVLVEVCNAFSAMDHTIGLCGVWEDNRMAEDIIEEILSNRTAGRTHDVFD